MSLRSVVWLALVLAGDHLHAADITSCGQVVAERESAALSSDLDCYFAPVGSNAVVLRRRATLDLRGHTIVPPRGGTGVLCDFGELICGGVDYSCRGRRGTCTVTSTSGRGLIVGGELPGNGIISERRVTVEHVDLRDLDTGIGAAYRGRLTAVDVSVRNCSDGVIASDVRVAGVEVSFNVGYGILADPKGIRGTDLTTEGNGQSGIDTFGRFKLVRLIARNNGVLGSGPGAGLLGGRGVLIDSLLTGNSFGGRPVDLATAKFPKLVNTACEHSERWEGAGVTWGVCSGD